MKEWLTILNAFIHDVATGTWIGTLTLLTIVHFETQTAAWIEHQHLVDGLEWKFFVLSLVSLAIINLTGVVRLVSWKVFGWTGDVERGRIRLLKIKHAVLGATFLAGTTWNALLVFGH